MPFPSQNSKILLTLHNCLGLVTPLKYWKEVETIFKLQLLLKLISLCQCRTMLFTLDILILAAMVSTRLLTLECET